MSDTAKSAHWSSRWVFLLATIGFSVGLGNVWKFPYVAGENGGGAFILVYLLAAFIIGMPLVMAEILIGRRGGGSPITSLSRLAHNLGQSRLWPVLGWLVMMTAFVLMSYYAVIAGWTLDYVFQAWSGRFAGMDGMASARAFEAMLASPWRLVGTQTLFLLLTLGIVAAGLDAGIERAVTTLIPLLFLLLLCLVVYALLVGDASAGLRFLFQPDFSRLSGASVLAAVGQAFFSIGVGMAAMMMYGAYLERRQPIPSSAAVVVLADTLVAVLAGIAIFPLVFQFGLDAAEGPGLVFVTLPVAFGQMPGGALIGGVFFMMLAIAALTSAIAICEPALAYAREKGVGRRAAAGLYGLMLWLAGLATVFSFNIWSHWRPASAIERLADASVFDILDFLSSNLMLPVGGLLIAIYAAWALPVRESSAELGLDQGRLPYRAWRFIVRWLSPLALLAILAAGLL